MKYLLLSIVLFPLLTVAQVAPKVSHRFFNDMDAVTMGGKWINKETKTKGLAHSGNSFSKIYKTSAYSAGITTKLPSDLARRNFNIAVYGWIRKNTAGAEDVLVTTITRKDSAVFWSGQSVASSAKPGEWGTFSFGMNIPRNIPPDSEIKIYIWHKDDKSETDIDDLDIYLSSTEMPSFLPK